MNTNFLSTIQSVALFVLLSSTTTKLLINMHTYQVQADDCTDLGIIYLWGEIKMQHQEPGNTKFSLTG